MIRNNLLLGDSNIRCLKIYEKRLKDLINNKIKYIDITDDIIDIETNVVKKEFVVPNDHHLDNNISHVWFERHFKNFIGEVNDRSNF